MPPALSIRYFLFAFLIQLAGIADAQNNTNITKGTVNVLDIVNMHLQRPLSDQFNEVFNEPDEEEYHPHMIATDRVHYYKKLQSVQNTGQPSPAPVTGFAAKVYDGYYPPDPHGAVSENYIVSTVNDELYTQDRNGNMIGDVRLLDFFASVRGGTRLFDPRIVYDQNISRWMLVTAANQQSDSSCLLLAVSQSSDPIGQWNLYKVKADTTDSLWADYPTIGFNKTWITVTVNIFGITSQSSDVGRIYLFDKQAMLNGQNTGVTTFSVDQGVSPAATYDSSVNAMYYLETYYEPAGQLQLLKVTGSVGAEKLTSVGFPAIYFSWAAQARHGQDIAPQLGTNNLIQCNDDRMGSVLCKNNVLWCTHTVFLPDDTAPSRTSILWWAVDTNAEVLQHGLIDDPTGKTFYGFPSIAVNKYNDALIGYSIFSPNIYASAGYSYHDHAQEPGSVNNTFIFKNGENTYYRSGSGRDRWGDCSATVTDPTNDIDFWTINEYAESTADNWGTYWSQVYGSDTINHDPATSQISVLLLPNPNNGLFNLYFTGQVNTPVGIDIYNMLGEHIYNTTASTDLNSIPINLSHAFAEGVYVIRLHLNSQTIDMKMAIHY